MSQVPMTVAFARSVARAPGAPALTLDEDTWTRRELWARVAQIADRLRQRGVAQDDLVAVLMPNRHDYVAASLAALVVGATAQPLSTRLAPRELAEMLSLGRPAVVLTHGHDVPPEHPVLRLDKLPLPDPATAPDPAAHTAPVARSWKAPGSGGSTGRPKVILSGLPALIDPAERRPDRLPVDGVVVVPGPLYHNGPFLFGMTGLMRGNHLVLSTRFDARRTLAQIERHRGRFAWVVPTMMSRIAALPEPERSGYDVSSLETVMHMASPCPRGVKEFWLDWLGEERILEGYGATEQVATTFITGPEWRERPGSVGRVEMGEMKIVTPAGEDAAPDEVGDVYHRPVPGTPISFRYLGEQPRTLEGGWIASSDVGWFDADGYLFLLDRRGDLILRGGANIYPAEVELALMEHPAVREAVVVGVPDADLGELVHAVVHAEGAVDPDALTAFLRERVSAYKVPAEYEFVDRLLRDDAGKVRRAAIREQVAQRRQATARG